MIGQGEVQRIGQIVKPHGVGGEMVVSVPASLDWTDDIDCLVCSLDGILVPFFLESIRGKSSTSILVKFEGYDSVDAIGRFMGLTVYMPLRYVADSDDEIPSWSTFLDWQVIDSAAGVLVDYKGLTVEEDTKLRKELREAGVTYFVEKNTILRFALHNAGYEGFDGVLEGTTAFAVSNDDQTAPARVLGKFGEQFNGEKLILKAGYIGEETYDAAGVKALSKIPSREILLAQLVGSLQGPIQKLAATLKAVADSKGGDAA